MDQLGAAPGRHRASQVESLALRARRFFEDPTEAEREYQLNQRDKMLARLDLKPFQPRSERDFEEWVDVAARKVAKFRMCAVLFQEGWEAVSSQSVAAVVGQIPADSDHEQMVGEVAKRLFPHSRYVEELEEELFYGKRQATVLEAEHWVISGCARYVRLCIRRGHDIGIGNSRLALAALRTLPEVVENEVRREGGRLTIDNLFTKAYSIEEELRRRHGELPQPHGPTPAFPVEEQADVPMTRRVRPDRIPGKCKGCGVTGRHFYKDCDKKTWRCYKCNEVGHNPEVYTKKGLGPNTRAMSRLWRDRFTLV
jgi:hypothetical protein